MKFLCNSWESHKDCIFNGYWLANYPWKFKFVIRNERIMHYIFNTGLIGDD